MPENYVRGKRRVGWKIIDGLKVCWLCAQGYSGREGHVKRLNDNKTEDVLES
jgi:hypothetical protein